MSKPLSPELHPLAPPLVVRVGFVGHRDLVVANPSLREATRQVLDLLATLVRDKARALPPGLYAAQAQPELRLLNALAEGADIIGAQIGLGLGYDLHAALPFSLEDRRRDAEPEYLAAFEDAWRKAEGRLILDGARNPFQAHDEDDPAHRLAKSRDTQSHAELAATLIRHADMFVALWDGDPGRGAGGTADLVRRALNRGAPVLVIPVNRGTSKVTGATYLLRKPQDVLEGRETNWQAPMGAYLDWLMNLPTRDHHGAAHAHTTPIAWIFDRLAGSPRSGEPTSIEAEIRAFYAERHVDPGAWGFHRTYRFMRDLLGSDPHKREKTASDAHQADVSTPPKIAALYVEPVDRIAEAAADKVRSGYIWGFLLAALALSVAGGSLAAPKEWGWGTALAILEAASILLIALIAFLSHKGRWHQRWLDYRMIAEMLRSVDVLLAFGRSVPFSEFSRSPSSDPHDAGHEGGFASWIPWYLRAVTRSLPMSVPRDPGSGAATIDLNDPEERMLRLRWLREGLFQDQITYHGRNHARLDRVAHRLEVLGQVFVLITLLLLGAKLLLHPPKEWSTIISLLTVILPAFGAAFFGIRAQSEAAAMADRSISAERKLKVLLRELDEIDPARGFHGMREAGELTRRAAEVMILENHDWFDVMGSKGVEVG